MYKKLFKTIVGSSNLSSFQSYYSQSGPVFYGSPCKRQNTSFEYSPVQCVHPFTLDLKFPPCAQCRNCVSRPSYSTYYIFRTQFLCHHSHNCENSFVIFSNFFFFSPYAYKKNILWWATRFEMQHLDLKALSNFRSPFQR